MLGDRLLRVRLNSGSGAVNFAYNRLGGDPLFSPIFIRVWQWKSLFIQWQPKFGTVAFVYGVVCRAYAFFS